MLLWTLEKKTSINVLWIFLLLILELFIPIKFEILRIKILFFKFLSNFFSVFNLFNKNKYKCIDIPKSYKTECFYLNNDKLMKKINIKNRLIDLEKDCKAISKLFFKKKNKWKKK